MRPFVEIRLAEPCFQQKQFQNPWQKHLKPERDANFSPSKMALNNQFLWSAANFRKIKAGFQSRPFLIVFSYLF